MDVLISTSAPEAPLYPEPIGLGDTTPRAFEPKEIEINITPDSALRARLTTER